MCRSCRSAFFSLAEEPLAEATDSNTNSGGVWETLRDKLPDHELVRELGRGGMGSVFLLRNRRLNRSEALKVLLPERSEDPRFEERFLRESRVLAQLRHPHIVSMYDCSELEDKWYILMDYIDGGSLRQAIPDPTLLAEDRIRIISEIAEAMTYAHSQGIIHRDINPNNVLLTKDREVRIVDFGLSKQLHTGNEDLSVTRPNEVMGTYSYMAPEQHDGGCQGDARSDVYALGAVAYEVLAQRLPRGVFPPPSAESACFRPFDRIVMRALEQDPDARYANAQEFLADWKRASERRPKTRSFSEGPSNPLIGAIQHLLSRPGRLGWGGVVGLALAIALGLPNPFLSSNSSEHDSTALPPSEPSLQASQDFLVPSLEMPMKWIAPGQSILGAHGAEDSDSSPPLPVELNYGFWMGVYEVTQLQYVHHMGNNPSYFGPNYNASEEGTPSTFDWRRRPVDSVTWREASEFCQRLTEESRRSGLIPDNYRFRLPTEIEWEYVCRAGDLSVSRDHFKSPSFLSRAWVMEDFGDVQQSQEVGTREPNTWGIYDLLGNVSEHCLNGWWYYPDYHGQSIRNWIDHGGEGDRIYRGGCFAQPADRANPYKRSSNAVDERDLAQGFRVVLSEEFPFVTNMLNSELPNGFEIDSLGIDMTWIPPGEFIMGEATASGPRGPAVSPETPTLIESGLWMGITEVTTFQWERVVEGDLDWLLQQPSSRRDTRTDLPVTEISWNQATNFCHQLTHALDRAGRLREGYIIRLPTEAEWEGACRRGHGNLYPFGDDPTMLSIHFGERARFKDNSNQSPGPVSAKGAGQSGLMGMYGNVREWCLDWKHQYTGIRQTNLLHQASLTVDSEKVIRGGDFLSEAALCTGTARSFAAPDFQSNRIGFRIVLARPIASAINQE